MAVTSIPKERLVKLIIDDLGAVDDALAYFHILPTTPVYDRLLSFTKDELLLFILQLGGKAEQALQRLETAFPLRRPPTLYLAIVESRPPRMRDIVEAGLALSEQGREGGMHFGESDTVRFIYIPQTGVSRFIINRLPIIEYQLQYEYRFEIVESDPIAVGYGQLKEIYSLETAFVWLPLGNHSHGVIACCDYPAVRRIQNFLRIKLDIDLNSPWLNEEMLAKITGESIPRSVTYSLQPFVETANEIQHITIADPSLETKPLYRSMVDNPNRERVAGFYSAHPGLALGGIGVARRDGKVWTPRRLDRQETMELSLAIIQQTETELGETTDFRLLTNYFYANRVKIGDNEIHGEAKTAWEELLPLVFEAQQKVNHEREISPRLINKLVQNEKSLRLLCSVEYDCPNCGVSWLAKCPDCNETLSVMYSENLYLSCPICHRDFMHHIFCDGCGADIEIADFTNFVRILPEAECNESMKKAAVKFKISYQGMWGIKGQALKWVVPRQRVRYPRVGLTDFRLWRNQARIDQPINSTLSPDKARLVLNKTLEKCTRGGTRSSDIKCNECKNQPINPDWIIAGDTCLLRLYGLPIGQKFDGVHHGHEVADLRYQDIFLDTGQQVNLGIHVKSRSVHSRPQGMGRKSRKIEGLYKQAVYSAFEAAILGKDIQVIGIAIPNAIKADVVDSMAYAINTLGFTFLVVDYHDWEALVRIAYEQSVFDTVS